MEAEPAAGNPHYFFTFSPVLLSLRRESFLRVKHLQYVSCSMMDQDAIAHLLDILGNRNRRRILDLLRQKPCFVTEISERLVINPKAVIEHLAIMQKEDVISFYQDVVIS